MNHPYILLNDKLKSLALARRWKEYNTFCYLQCNQKLKTKTNLVKLRYFINEDLLEGLTDSCALCLNKYNYCVVC
jgi:hypothetical protein